MRDFKLKMDSQSPVPGLDLKDEEGTIKNNIALSLLVRKGGWWHDPEFGLDLPRSVKRSARLVATLRQRIEEALKWILDVGWAKEMNVYVEPDADDPGRVDVMVEAEQTDGLKVTFETFLEV